jgi:uncharacterized GH25 family protein
MLFLLVADKAVSDVVFKCSYDKGFMEDEFKLSIEVVKSGETETAYMTGNVTKKEVEIIPASSHKNFLDVASNGNVFMTTILANDKDIETALYAGDFINPTMFESVHSRHYVDSIGAS